MNYVIWTSGLDDPAAGTHSVSSKAVPGLGVK